MEKGLLTIEELRKLRTLARRAAEARSEAQTDDARIEEWAEKLAESVSDADD